MNIIRILKLLSEIDLNDEPSSDDPISLEMSSLVHGEFVRVVIQRTHTRQILELEQIWTRAIASRLVVVHDDFFIHPHRQFRIVQRFRRKSFV